MIRHHPTEMTVIACAAGSLPAPHARVVAAHAALCPTCRAALDEAAEVGGALLDTLPPAPLAPDALERTFAKLEAQPAIENAVVAPLMLEALARGIWRWSGPGIALMPLIRRDATDSRLDLIRVAPGTGLLEHGHSGLEMTCVLQGGFDDGIGQYRAGDFVEMDTELVHRPTALSGEDCICLIASSGHLRARSLLGWLVRPFLGM
jgi:putative transcriptional regulator